MNVKVTREKFLIGVPFLVVIANSKIAFVESVLAFGCDLFATR